MSSNRLKSLADFEWGSVARYIVYISSVARLEEINSSHVNSFPLARLGPEKLYKQKKRVLLLLERNKASIERFVIAFKGELAGSEVAVLRSLYLQYRDNEETVRGHLDVIGACVVEIELGLLREEEVDDEAEF